MDDAPGEQPGDGDAGQQGHQQHHQYRLAGAFEDQVAGQVVGVRLFLHQLAQGLQAVQQRHVAVAMGVAHQHPGAFGIARAGEFQHRRLAAEVVAGEGFQPVEQRLFLGVVHQGAEVCLGLA
ncbi:hypothetical protein D3C78_1496490 [compost metagenome]